MKIKRNYFIIGILILIIAILSIRFLSGSEDSWIKDKRGVWIMHGHPAEIPDYVLEQQEAINCAYEKFVNFNGEPNSQCLGVCGIR